MHLPPASDKGGEVNIVDLSRPFHGLVLCCTDIEADLRSQIAQCTAEMGGLHRYDLTPDVTHLIVGNYNTAKYRHVAKERPDIKPMAAGWIDAVRSLWIEDQEMDLAALEEHWQLKVFEAGGGIPNSPNPAERERQPLICCLTGFEDNNVRAMIEDTVRANGGEYVADLSRKVTHLIVSKPEGKKYSAACRWGIRCVSLEWLQDSADRGMILSEDCYDPTLPDDERGKGACVPKDHQRVALGKRTRDDAAAVAEAGRRKLRKRASVKMNSQNNNLWGDILNQSAGDLSRPDDAQRESSVPTAPLVVADSITSATESAQPAAQPAATVSLSDNSWPALRKGVFHGCRFFVHGFPQPKEQVLFDFLTSHSGQLSSTLENVASPSHSESFDRRFLLVPQTSQPDTHPTLPEGVHIITEFFIERCIHNKTLYSPTEHVWGQPFPRFPVDGFENLTICTAGFANEQLNQIEKTIIQLGAKYSEKLNRQVSLLVCPDLASLREQKRDLAIYHNIAIIDVEWLWQCITTGCLVPWDRFQFEELLRTAETIRADLRRREEQKRKARGEETLNRTRSEPVLRNPPTVKPPAAKLPAPRRPPARAGFDLTAFSSDPPAADSAESPPRNEEAHDSSYKTAPTDPHLHSNPQPFDDAFAPEPLSETTASALNRPKSRSKSKSVSPPKEQEKLQEQEPQVQPAPAPEPQEAQPQPQPQSDRTLKRYPTGGEVGDSEAGEDSDATTSRKGRDEEKDKQEKAKEKDVEAERRRAKELERLELSKRLNSLMGDGLGFGSGSGTSAQEGGGNAQKPPVKRKRQILGRAASNASVGSSGSGESASAALSGGLSTALSGNHGHQNERKNTKSGGGGGGSGGGGQRQLQSATSMTISAASAGSDLDKLLEANGDAEGVGNETLPPSTQLGYEDPDANKHRQVLMGKMLGGGGGVKGGSGTGVEGEGKGLEKLRLADLVDGVAREKELEREREAGSTAAGAGKRRTTRRQGR
ncbi:hypothetical protein F4808DRAFT_461308 [Astrocystis sublimbata]|nr:hypothetical protein F4808DRAFT_461308 [Astrocystis sublimbata]